MNTTSSVKTLEFISGAKQIFNQGMECFNHCVEDYTTNKVDAIEKHCLEGCMQVKINQYSSAAIRTPVPQ
eukprot:403336669